MVISIFSIFSFFFYYVEIFSYPLFIFFSLVFLGLSYGFYENPLFFSDQVSFLLVFVTFVVFSSCFLVESEGYKGKFVLFFMFFLLCYSFYFVNFVMFFVFFEFVFVLMFFYLYSYGSSPDRVQASFYMFFYTAFFSFPFLILLVYFFGLGGTSFFSLSFTQGFSLFWVFLVFLFSAKLPLYGVHLWLPKAHVQAPVVGSMVLAGVLLKLGGYGFIRFFPLLNIFLFDYFFIDFIFYVSLYGGLLVSFICIRQTDLKMLIAYSSVVHMSIMMCGLLSFSVGGLYGSVLMMISHGMISPMMFFFLGVIYSEFHSRSIFIMKGALGLFPAFCLWWFFCCFLNLSLPPFMSFVSEVFIVGSMTFLDFFSAFIVVLFLFFCGVYCVFSFSFLSHGSSLFNCSSFLDLKASLVGYFLCCYVFSFPFLFL